MTQTLEYAPIAVTETVDVDKAPEVAFPPLTALDRCDCRTRGGNGQFTSCAAQAFIRAVLPSGEDLLFCGHHLGEQVKGVRYEGSTKKAVADITRREALERAGATFLSQYDEINTKPSPSANKD